MKPLLRAVLIVDALLLLAFGVLFLLTPWTSLYNALQLVQPQPAFVGQAFGIALVGLAWLALHASIDGAMTSTVAKVAGHVEWLSGVVMLVWLIGLHTPPLTGFGQLVAGLAAVGLLVLGLGSVRLASAVRRREKGQVAQRAQVAQGTRAVESATAARSAKPSAQGAAAVSGSEPAFSAARYRVEPTVVEPARPESASAYQSASVAPSPSATVSEAPVSPGTGHPVEPGLTATPARDETRDGASAAAGQSTASAATGAATGTSAARDEARREAAGAPRPPFHG